MLGRSPLSNDSRPWNLSALGDLDTAGARGSDIEHVVVGPPGVFSISSRFHEGAHVWVGSRRLLVDGQKTDHLRSGYYEITRTQKLLPIAVGAEIPVHGAIVIAGAGEVKIRE